MRKGKALGSYSKLFLFISLSCIFIFWFLSLISVFYLHKIASLNDKANISSFLTEGFSYTEDWDFIQDLWDKRPSIMALSLNCNLEGEDSYRIFSYRSYYKSFLPFQISYPLELEFTLLDSSSLTSEVIVIYSLLPWEEFIYYSFITLLLFAFVFILYFIFTLKVS